MGSTLAKLSEREEREQRNGTIRDSGDILPVSSEENVKEEKLTKSWDLLPKMIKSWNKASSFVFGNCSECVQKLQTLDYEKGTREGLDKLRGTEEKEITSIPVDYPGSNNLKDTSQMLKTEKKILVRRMTESKAVPQKLMTLDDERIQRDGFAQASETMGELNTTSQTVAPKKRVISEYDKELQDRLQKFKANVNEEKERIRLTCNEVLRDSFQKLHEAMLKEEKYIKSKCDGALRESVQKLQHNIQDEKKRIKSAYNQVLTDSLQELQNRTEEEMRRIRSTYLDR
uniref:Uncharacterized protein n=1 Tax=Kalanchoe fedtschenkoi TaxID=63787 RepID=A0A7N0UDP6_KALFE